MSQETAAKNLRKTKIVLWLTVFIFFALSVYDITHDEINVVRHTNTNKLTD